MKSLTYSFYVTKSLRVVFPTLGRRIYNLSEGIYVKDVSRFKNSCEKSFFFTLPLSIIDLNLHLVCLYVSGVVLKKSKRFVGPQRALGRVNCWYVKIRKSV